MAELHGSQAEQEPGEGQQPPLVRTFRVDCVHPPEDGLCKERYKEGLLWAGRGTIPDNELA